MTKDQIDALIDKLEAEASDVEGYTGEVLREAAAALREQQEEIERLTHLINIDWDCLPTCNSFGHDPECPYCNGEPKLRLLVERVADLEADREMLREVGQKDYDG